MATDEFIAATNVIIMLSHVKHSTHIEGDNSDFDDGLHKRILHTLHRRSPDNS
jgi:hypothetical protein